jgi:hypothetical protein
MFIYQNTYTGVIHAFHLGEKKKKEQKEFVVLLSAFP